MDATLPSVSAKELADRISAGRFPCLVDVRREERYAESDVVVRGARRRAPDRIEIWAQNLPDDGEVIVYCVHGHEVSQNAAAALRKRGFNAAYLEGGIEGWREAGGALQPKPPAEPSRWITRERPKIDRIACPWLVRRFIDPRAEFVYVPTAQVFTEATRRRGVAYDIPGAPITHVGELCSFDALLAAFDLRDAALERLATIVRGADTDRLDLALPSAGLLAFSLGLSRLHADDAAMLEAAMPLYDALYAWCREARTETHQWKPETMTGAAL